MAEERTQRRLAAILAVDVFGYSQLTSANEVGMLIALRGAQPERLDPAVVAHRGRIVKLMANGALIEFASAVDAVECAIAFQKAMADHNAARTEQDRIEFRVGVNLGEIALDGDYVFGDGVNVAARLVGKAPKNGILVSDTVHAQIKDKVSVTFIDAGEVQTKASVAYTEAGALNLESIETPVRVWRWCGIGATEE